MKVSTGQIPPNGWHYPQGPGHTITADTYELLIEAIFTFRLRAGKPEGNIKKDVDRYYCQRWPQFCQTEPSDFGIKSGPETDKRDPMSKRVARFAARMSGNMPQGGYLLVPQFEANDRAAICAACPMNVPWKSGCSSCTASTANMLLQIRKLRNTPIDGKLLGCNVSGHENATAVHLPDVVMKITDPDILAFLPEKCWKNKIL